MSWISTEFPQFGWANSQLFGVECIAASIRQARIYVKVLHKNNGAFRYGIDFDSKDNRFNIACDDLIELKDSIIACIKEVDPKLLSDIQPSLL